MGLQESLEENRKKLEEALEAEKQELENDTEEEIVEENEVSPVVEEEKLEEEEIKEKVEEEPELDDKGHRRLRREAASEKKRADELERINKELQEKLATVQENSNSESFVDNTSSEIKEIIQTHRFTQAEREFQSMEANFRQHAKDYDAVADAYAKGIYQSIRIQNPRLSPSELHEKTKETILLKASHYVKQGYDPIEELYEEAKSLGFTGVVKEDINTRETKKTDLSKLAQNRQRNSGMAASRGAGLDVEPTRTHVATQFTNEEWIKLKPEQKKRYLAGG